VLGAVVAYIAGEGFVDAAAAGGTDMTDVK